MAFHDAMLPELLNDFSVESLLDPDFHFVSPTSSIVVDAVN
jgi:hypothetical protein